MKSSGNNSGGQLIPVLHRRQKVWQILLPIVLVTLTAITLFVLLLIQNTGAASSISEYSSISIIWLILPVMVGSLFVLLVLAGFIYLIHKLTGAIPLFGLKARTIVYNIALFLHKAADKSVIPTMKLHQIRAAWKTIIQKFRPR